MGEHKQDSQRDRTNFDERDLEDLLNELGEGEAPTKQFGKNLSSKHRSVHSKVSGSSLVKVIQEEPAQRQQQTCTQQLKHVQQPQGSPLAAELKKHSSNKGLQRQKGNANTMGSMSMSPIAEQVPDVSSMGSQKCCLGHVDASHSCKDIAALR